MNGGIVIKTNSNQRYATNSASGFVVREIGRICKVPIQEFCGKCF
jgi:aspartyl aminopeptidase